MRTLTVFYVFILGFIHLKMSVTGKGPLIDSGECRCCGAIKRCRLLNVEYQFMGTKEVYSEMFVECFGLVLSHLEEEEGERLICATCVQRLRAAADFRAQVLRCEGRLLRDSFRLGDGGEEPMKSEMEVELKVERQDTDNNNDGESGCDADDWPAVESEGTARRSETEPSKRTSPRRKVKEKRAGSKKSRDHSPARQDMLASMRRTKEKLKKALRNEKASNPEIVRVEGATRVQKMTRAFANTITIVEGSYACPFLSVFNTFYCEYCRQRFPEHRLLRDHCRGHDPVTFKDAIVDSMRRLGRKKTQLDIQRIDCRLCPERIDDIERLKEHLATVHGKTIYPVADEFLQFRVTERLECAECGRGFRLFQALKKHMAEHFGTYTCDVCGASFFNETYLTSHQRSHGDGKPVLYTCEECGRSFKLKYSRDMHVALRHRRQPAFQCVKCDDAFYSSRQRFKHMAAAHGERCTYRCSRCERVYDSRKTLLDHVRRIHVKVLKHKCEVCERRFYLPSMLREHMAAHTGERGFRCMQCDKTYPRMKALKVHLQAHAAVKRHQCPLCSASYGQRVSLQGHLKRAHAQPAPIA